GAIKRGKFEQPEREKSVAGSPSQPRDFFSRSRPPPYATNNGFPIALSPTTTPSEPRFSLVWLSSSPILFSSSGAIKRGKFEQPEREKSVAGSPSQPRDFFSRSRPPPYAANNGSHRLEPNNN
ncbi:U3 small nucleolar RNA-associated protein 25, partial [Striga asiatica]